MTVQEVKTTLEALFSDSTGENYPYTDQFGQAVHTAIQALEEVEQYRAIAKAIEDFNNAERETLALALEELKKYRALGTVEELKEAREKQIPKTPNIEGDGYADRHLVYDTWICPNCDAEYEIDYDDYDYCPKCGQAINKSVIEGGREDD